MKKELRIRCFPFLLTPLREGRHGREGIPRRAVGNFYSRPCGRGDAQIGDNASPEHISTHAPAGGATVTVMPRVQSDG